MRLVVSPAFGSMQRPNAMLIRGSLASPRLASPRLASPRLASHRIASPPTRERTMIRTRMHTHACGTHPACAARTQRVRSCVRACLCKCAHGPTPSVCRYWRSLGTPMRATADRACSGAARYPQPLYISGVNRFITVRRSASKANKRNDRRPAHKRATCRVSASEARLQRQCGAWRHRAWDAGIRLLDVHGERPLRCELVPS
jgi:hypothetical protein